jgi:hypothetical protein
MLFTQNTYINLPQPTKLFLSVTRGIAADVSFELVHSQVLRTKTIIGRLRYSGCCMHWHY